MARAIHWQVPFVSLNGTAYTINIYEEGYTGDPITLMGASQPFEIQENSDEDIFSPIRTHTGYIHIVCNDVEVAESIFPSNALDRYVELVSNGVVCWFGYIKAESYGYNWSDFPVVINLPIVSPLEAIGDEPFEPCYNGVSVGKLIYRIFSQVAKVTPMIVVCAKVEDENGCAALSATLDDGQFHNSDSENKAYFNGDSADVTLPTSGYTVKNVLEHACRAFGLQFHEHGKILYFTTLDNNNATYVKATFSSLNTSNPTFTVLNTEDVALPDVASTDCQRSFVSGYSFIQTASDIEEPFDMLETDLLDCEADSTRKYVVSRESGTGGQMGIYYMRSGTTRIIPSTTTDILSTNRNAGSVSVVGGNILSFMSATPGQSAYTQYNFDNLEEYALISFPSSGSSYHQVLELHAKNPARAREFTDCGLVFNFMAKASADTQLFEFDKNPCVDLYVSIKWGDYYYSDTDTQGVAGWTNTEVKNRVIVRGDNYAEGGEGYAHNPSEEDAGYVSAPRVKGFKIAIPEGDYTEHLGGDIVIKVYVLRASNSCKQMLMSNFTLEPIKYQPYNYNDSSKEHYKVDYRASLGVVGNRSVYSYDRKLLTLGEGCHYARNVIDTEAQMEQTIIDRLSLWYNRSIETIDVTVNGISLKPVDTITYGGHRYAIESKAVNYIDNNTKLSLQRLP